MVCHWVHRPYLGFLRKVELFIVIIHVIFVTPFHARSKHEFDLREVEFTGPTEPQQIMVVPGVKVSDLI